MVNTVSGAVAEEDDFTQPLGANRPHNVAFPSMTTKALSMLGIQVWPRSLQQLLREIETDVCAKEKAVVPNHNLHSAALAKRDSRFRLFFDRYPGAHIDGMALVFWGKLLGFQLHRKHRVTYLDLIGPLLRLASDNSWRVFHVGGKRGVGERAALKLRQEYGVDLAVWHGFFDTEESLRIVERIRTFRPQLVLVGMGMPRQEYWLMDMIDELPNAVYLCAGGCFDYIAGEQTTPPRWAGPVGLEWFFRLLSQPRRLSSRYLIEPLTLVPEMGADIARTWGRRSGRGQRT